MNSSLLHQLKQLDETTLIDLLSLTSEEIVDAFLDKIYDKQEYLYTQLQDKEE